MKIKLKIVAIVFMIISCSNGEKFENQPNTTFKALVLKSQKIQKDTTKIILVCYQGVLKNDTIKLNLTIQSLNVSGKLSYHYFEKESNFGEVQGILSGDTLTAMYTFISKGLVSKRQVVFLTKNNTVLEGSGEQIVQNGQLVFLQKSKLDFTESAKLYNVRCK